MKKIVCISLAIVLIGLSSTVFAQDTTTTTTPSPTTPEQKGMTIIDPSRGADFTAPNDNWGITAGKYSIRLTHKKHYDANVTLKKSWFKVATAQDAYSKRKSGLKDYLPGARFIKENQTMTIGGSTAAISMTYENTGELKIFREIMFVHKNQAYELVFQAKKENFPKVKDDFSYILSHMKLY